MSYNNNEKFENGLFIFRRDFRIIDNNGLNLINSKCKNVFTIFIFTPEQVTNANKFKSDNAVQFMIESLQDLEEQIRRSGGKLYCFFGKNDIIIKKLINILDINYLCFNADYTPYAINRDYNILSMCNQMNIVAEYAHDYYLHPPGTIMNGSGEPYKKFTPFYTTCLQKKVELPSKLRKMNLSKSNKLTNAASSVKLILLDKALNKFTKYNKNILVHGGRIEALARIKKYAKEITNYKPTHNNVDVPTSELSAYIKFGCISIREVYKTFKGKRDFIRQLIWRDFYANILFSFPYVLGNSMKENYNKLKWHHNESWFHAWCNGNTGFPIVDAGMRQLNITGYMHNRARLIVASFLVKTLLISWEKGEKYFAEKLTDYDPASNNGNWQWVASTGADSQPYFRIFNPWEQLKHFDSECKYVKSWIPELADVPNRDIFNWDTEYDKYKSIKYPKPICDYKKQKELALHMYSSVFSKK